jgi:ketosteroid isomerase-like protein
MSGENSLAVVQGAYQSFQRGDIAAVLNVLADDIEWNSLEVAGTPHRASRRGKASVAEFFRQLGDAEEVQQFDAHEFIADGERVVAVVRYRARVKATGRVLETPLVHIFTVKAGKVTRFLEMYDTAVLERAFERATSA